MQVTRRLFHTGDFTIRCPQLSVPNSNKCHVCGKWMPPGCVIWRPRHTRYFVYGVERGHGAQFQTFSSRRFSSSKVSARFMQSTCLRSKMFFCFAQCCTDRKLFRSGGVIVLFWKCMYEKRCLHTFVSRQKVEIYVASLQLHLHKIWSRTNVQTGAISVVVCAIICRFCNQFQAGLRYRCLR